MKLDPFHIECARYAFGYTQVVIPNHVPVETPSQPSHLEVFARGEKPAVSKPKRSRKERKGK